MSLAPILKIYNASAGSGKTFSLVKSFLSEILKTQKKDHYKHALAITFTNKAVAEMKERIILALTDFSAEVVPKRSSELFHQISEEIQIQPSQLKSKSQQILNHILHHYAQLSIETIDHFNLRLLRTFSKDLLLPSNFEVSLETEALHRLAVDNLLERAGRDPAITNILVQFALSKTEDDKSWDIAYDLTEIAGLLAKETHYPYLEALKDKAISVFESLKIELNQNIESLADRIKKVASQVLELIDSHALDGSHFYQYVYNFFVSNTTGKLYTNWSAKWIETLGEKPLHPKKITPEQEACVEGITPQLIDAINQIREASFQVMLYENINKNLVPLACLQLIQKEIDSITSDQKILPIYVFNSLIHKQVKDQPAPYIYERLGDRYRHFFIDEFQDTSKMQWQNLIPLIDNALSQASEEGSLGNLMLVGDAKQSIYRFRGGLPEQFISLYNQLHPFSINPQQILTANLETNYRSHEQLITFNNSFFCWISNRFQSQTHTELYQEGNQQKSNSKKDGYVHLELLEPVDDVDAADAYSVKCLDTVKHLLNIGFNGSDICILTRKKKEAIHISEHLIANHVAVVSEETLLLKNTPYVQALIDLFHWSVSPNNNELKLDILIFLYNHLQIDQPLHTFLKDNLELSMDELEAFLSKHRVILQFKTLAQKPLYEGFEYLINALSLNKNMEASLDAFMTLVFDYSKRFNDGISQFLIYWDTEKENVALPESQQPHAVQIMTIHKSKGLEFPVVIFPFADLKFDSEKSTTVWYPTNYNDFKHLPITYKKEIASYSDAGQEIFETRQSQLELDTVNLCYVAFTRAIQQLYVFGLNDPKATQNSFNGLLKEYIQQETQSSEPIKLSLGDKNFIAPIPSEISESKTVSNYCISEPVLHGIKWVTTDTSETTKASLDAVTFGNLLHETMALVKHRDDVSEAMDELKLRIDADSDLFKNIERTVTNIIFHPDLIDLFQSSDTIYMERDIIYAKGILRPDRINIRGQQAIIIDYKTGSPDIAHQDQINAYANALTDLGFQVSKKLIVYVNQDEIVINKI